MDQAQQGFQCADQCAAGGALLGQTGLPVYHVHAGLDLHLGYFQVPVAELVPRKVIDGVGDVVQAVVGKTLCDFGLGLLQ